MLAASSSVVRGVRHGVYAELLKLVANADNLVALTGAGVSTESGIPDYRSPAGSCAFSAAVVFVWPSHLFRHCPRRLQGPPPDDTRRVHGRCGQSAPLLGTQHARLQTVCQQAAERGALRRGVARGVRRRQGAHHAERRRPAPARRLAGRARAPRQHPFVLMLGVRRH
jgi:hypothetical protein